MYFKHEATNPNSVSECDWWTERWIPFPYETYLIQGRGFGMLRLKDKSLVVLRYTKAGEQPEFEGDYVIVGRPETVEAGKVLMELLAEKVE